MESYYVRECQGLNEQKREWSEINFIFVSVNDVKNKQWVIWKYIIWDGRPQVHIDAESYMVRHMNALKVLVMTYGN